MAIHFVNSGAAGANNGTSWTDAWVSAASSSGVAAGDIVKIHLGHNETALTAAINWANGTLSNPVRIICVDKDNSDALAAGAVVGFTTTSSIGPQGNIYSYGITWRSNISNMIFLPPSNGMQVHEAGVLTSVDTSQAIITFGNNIIGRNRIRLINETVDFSVANASTARITFALPRGIVEWYGGSYTLRSFQLWCTSFSEGAPDVFIRGVAFSGTASNAFILGNGSNNQGRITIEDCVTPSYSTLVSVTFDSYAPQVKLHRCVSGTITVPAIGPTSDVSVTGTVSTTLTRYRTGGADDGEQANAHSWEMAANANAADFTTDLVSPPLTRWVEPGAQTLTVYVASGVTLQDDECWVEVFSPSEAGSATAQTHFRSSRAAPLATPVDLTTDGSSTWNGSGVGTKQKIDVAINPTIPGWTEVRVHLAKPSTTIYVDPAIWK